MPWGAGKGLGSNTSFHRCLCCKVKNLHKIFECGLSLSKCYGTTAFLFINTTHTWAELPEWFQAYQSLFCSIFIYLFLIKFVLIIVVYNIKLTFCLQCHIPFSWPFVYIWGSPQVTHQLWGHKHSLESPPFLLTINVPNLYFLQIITIYDV